MFKNIYGGGAGGGVGDRNISNSYIQASMPTIVNVWFTKDSYMYAYEVFN